MSEATSVWSKNHTLKKQPKKKEKHNIKLKTPFPAISGVEQLSGCKRRRGVCSLKLLKQPTDASLMFTASVAGQHRNQVRGARWNAALIKRGFVPWSMSSMGLFLPLLVLIWAPSRIISRPFASPAMQHCRAEPCSCDSLSLRCWRRLHRCDHSGQEVDNTIWGLLQIAILCLCWHRRLKSNWNRLH